MGAKAISVENHVIKNELHYEGRKLLTFKIEYPEFHAEEAGLCLLMVNRYYREKAIRYQNYCETVLYPDAVKQFREDLEHGYPVRMFEAVLTYQVTYAHSCALSLYLDFYQFTGGAHGATTREAQTWNLTSCSMFRPRELILCAQGYKAYILDNVLHQAAMHPELYFEDYRKLIPQFYRKNSFYCTKQGIVVFFQQYEIAPYAAGIVEFLIPYSDCVKNPGEMCHME